MRARRLRTGASVTELGFGAAQIGNLYRELDDAAACAAVDAAWDQGIRYFDTAPHYGLGLSERRLGAALASRPRDEFVLSTKVGRLLKPADGPPYGQDNEGFSVPAAYERVRDYSRDGVLRSLEASLERLGLDRIDIVYVHDPDGVYAEAAITQAIPALIELRDQGVVSAIGLGMNDPEVPVEAIKRTDLDIVMIAGRYTALEQPAAKDLLPLALERKIDIVAVGVYNSGLLSQARPAPDATYNYEPAPLALIARANAIADIAERHGVTLPEVALHFALRHPAVASVVLGMRTAEQVEQNMMRYNAVIPSGVWDELADAGLIPGEAEGEHHS